MNFNTHSELEGQHAFLSPSRYHWINYDEEKLDSTFKKRLATERGTRLHMLASECIELGVVLQKSKKTFNAYVNDAIGYKMTTEQPLKYSSFCFGHADAISFRQNFLRIHDLKNGETPASMRQLEVYAAIFCLEYNFDPAEIKIELRIYQQDEIIIHEPTPNEIYRIMDKIIISDKRLEKLMMGEV